MPVPEEDGVAAEPPRSRPKAVSDTGPERVEAKDTLSRRKQEETTESGRPAKSGQGKGVVLLAVGAGVFLLLLAGGVVGTLLLFRNPGKEGQGPSSEPVAHLPGNDSSRKPAAQLPKPAVTKPPADQSPARGTRPPPTLPQRADFSMTAEAFYDEVIDDISAAQKKFDGRIVELTGKVRLLGRHPLDPKGPPSISVGEPGHLVNCQTVDKQPWLKCALNQSVKVRGKVNGSLLFAAVGMQDCEFTVVSGDPATPLMVDQLLKEIAADEDAAEKKYHGKIVLLTGDFVGVKKDKSGHKVAELKGDDKRPIYCRIWDDDRILKKVKPGTPVTFLGELKVTLLAKLKLGGDKIELHRTVLTQLSGMPQ